MTRLIRRFTRDESGATAIEYGIIVAMIFMVIVGSVTLFADAAAKIFNDAMAVITANLG